MKPLYTIPLEPIGMAPLARIIGWAPFELVRWPNDTPGIVTFWVERPPTSEDLCESGHLCEREADAYDRDLSEALGRVDQLVEYLNLDLSEIWSPWVERASDLYSELDLVEGERSASIAWSRMLWEREGAGFRVAIDQREVTRGLGAVLQRFVPSNSTHLARLLADELESVRHVAVQAIGVR